MTRIYLKAQLNNVQYSLQKGQTSPLKTQRTQKTDLFPGRKTRTTSQFRSKSHGPRDATGICRDFQHGTSTQTQRDVQGTRFVMQIAIEYYVNEDPRKANHFQKKLTGLLAHPYTLELIEKKPEMAKTP